MANHWEQGTTPPELEPPNKKARLDSNEKPLNQSTESEESTNGANLAASSTNLLEIIKQVEEFKLDLEIQRKDPKSPLYSETTFDALNLKPNLLKGVNAMGFNAPSKVQETALSTLLANPPQSLIAQAQSGTGKTVALVLAMLSRVDSSEKYPQVLCVSPTYELAMQIGESAATMARFCPEIKLRNAVRGEDLPVDNKITEHIIIGTPGKIFCWGVKLQLFDMRKIKVIVLDDADNMIHTDGHGDTCLNICLMLPSTIQMILFSTTYNSELDLWMKVMSDFKIVPDPIIIRLLRDQESLDNIKQYYVMCNNSYEKYIAICNIYRILTKSIGKAIIFCETRNTASWLYKEMSKDRHSVAVLSSYMTVTERSLVLDKFRAGLEKVLITTNMLSQGIDVEQVTLVVNFDMPMDLEDKADFKTYLHRIGRTGRFGKAGIAINLIEYGQTSNTCKEIEEYFGKEIPKIVIEDAN